jgi:hypothetical protein
MNRRTVLIVGTALALAACTTSSASRVGPDGRPLPQVYPITPANQNAIYFRLLDSTRN